MGWIKCAVKSCPTKNYYYPTRRKKNSPPHGLSFFQSKSKTRLENWKKSLGMDLKESDNICHLHFKQEDMKTHEQLTINGEVVMIPYKKKILNDKAVPTIEHQFIPIQKNEQRVSILHLQDISKSYPNQSKDEQRQRIQESNTKQQELLQESFKNNTMDYNEETEKDLEESFHQQPQNTSKNNQDTELRTESFETFIDDMRKSILPEFWLYSDSPYGLDFMRMDQNSKLIKHHIRINGDLSITVVFSNNDEMPLTKKINSFEEIYDYLKYVERWPLCLGIHIDDLHYYSTFCEGVIVGDDTKISEQNPRCEHCRALRTELRKRKELKLSTRALPNKSSGTTEK